LVAQYFSIQTPESHASFPPPTTHKLRLPDFTKQSRFFSGWWVLESPEITLNLLGVFYLFLRRGAFGEHHTEELRDFIQQNRCLLMTPNWEVW